MVTVIMRNIHTFEKLRWTTKPCDGLDTTAVVAHFSVLILCVL